MDVSGMSEGAPGLLYIAHPGYYFSLHATSVLKVSCPYKMKKIFQEFHRPPLPYTIYQDKVDPPPLVRYEGIFYHHVIK